jgi:hypothetical protein
LTVQAGIPSYDKAQMLRLSTAILALALSGSAFAADRVFPPGSRIGLIPPSQMKVARAISGFQDPSTGAAIVTIEMPAEAYPSVAAGFTDEALKAQGFALKSRDAVKVGAADALLISGTQTDAGRAVPKSILLAADPTLTALVIAQAPVGASSAAQEELRAALKTVAFRAPLSIDEQLAALPFRLGDTGGFRPVRAMAGNSVLLTDGPNNVVRNAEQPVLIVAQSFAPGPSAPEQREAFARNALVGNSLLKEPVLERSQGFRLGGADWHEIVAKAKDGASDQPVIVMQTIRFAPDSYVRTIGVARPEQRDDLLPRFRRVVDGLVLK